MTTITIKVPEQSQNQLSEFVKQLGGEILSIKKGQAQKKDKLLSEIKQGLTEVKAIREGKMKALTMSDLLNGE